MHESRGRGRGRGFLLAACGFILLAAVLPTQATPALACTRASRLRRDGEALGTGAVWGYSILAVSVISIASFGLALLLFLIPPGGNTMRYAMSFSLSLGTGVLIGDAVIHLIPAYVQSVLEGNDHDEHLHDEPLLVWKGCMVLAAIYLLYLVEKILHTYTGHSHTSHTSHVHVHVQGEESHTVEGEAHAADHEKGLEIVNVVSTVPHEHNKQHPDCVQPMGWLIIIGDSLHNFIDGLAIAASFASPLRLGLSTSLAIFLHEIPHELADFAILMAAHFEKKRIVAFTLAATAFAYLGTIVGITVMTSQATQSWVFGITAGTFLYIALTNVIPELVHNNNRLVFILIETAGIWIGYIIMVLLALYGEDIKL